MARELVTDLAIRYGFQVLGAIVILAVGAIKIDVGPWVKVVDVGPAEGELNRSLAEQFQGRGLTLGPGPAAVRLVNGAAAPSR